MTITNATTPEDGGSIDSTSFTIGLFDDDDAQCTPHNRTNTPSAKCAILADLSPTFRGHYEEYLNATPHFSAFEDTSVVEAKINVGDSGAAHWTWTYEAYYEDPINSFWVDVVDQTGAITRVQPVVSAPPDWGWAYWILFVGNQSVYSVQDQEFDLDLTPWSNQTISVRFSLRNNYDPTYFNRECPGACSGFDGAFDLPTAKVYVSNFRVDTCKVTSVELEARDSPLDGNPLYAGGGKRIFPDATSPTDGTNRAGVNVVVHSQPNCRINLRSFDVDDSTDDPIIDTNGLLPDDNNLVAGGADYGQWVAGPGREVSIKTGSNGIGRTEFRVSDLPGANFVIVADKDVSKLRTITTSGTNMNWSDGREVPASARTEMVTVWRHLHIERDAMEPVANNHVSGRILAVTPNPQCGANSPVGIRVDAVLARHPNLLGRFQFGRLVVGNRSLAVTDNLAQTICVPGTAAALRGLQGQPFTLYDDDDFNRNDGAAPRGDEGEPLRIPSAAMLQDSDTRIDNVLAAAYIRPTYDIGGGTAPFVLNVPEYNNLGAHFAFNNAANSAPDFWTVYLLGAYQGKEDHCNDPPGATLRGISNRDGSLIFLESIADFGALASGDESDVVAHEVGHLLCTDHGDAGLMGGPAGGIAGHAFSSISIAKIRKGQKFTEDGCP